MNQTDLRKQNSIRIQQLGGKVLDDLELVLNQMTTPPPPLNQPPLAVARRQLANMLGLWRLCAERACHRAHCCRGEPLHCLHIALPSLPPEAFAACSASSPSGGARQRDAARRRARRPRPDALCIGARHWPDRG